MQFNWLIVVILQFLAGQSHQSCTLSLDGKYMDVGRRMFSFDSSPGIHLKFVGKDCLEGVHSNSKKVNNTYIPKSDDITIMGEKLGRELDQLPEGFIVATVIRDLDMPLLENPYVHRVLLYLGVDIQPPDDNDVLMFLAMKGYPSETKYSYQKSSSQTLTNLFASFGYSIHTLGWTPALPSFDQFQSGREGWDDLFLMCNQRFGGYNPPIRGWQYKAVRSGRISAGVWRAGFGLQCIQDSTDATTLLGIGVHTFNVESGEGAYCLPPWTTEKEIVPLSGDMVGFYVPTNGAGSLAFTDSSDHPMREDPHSCGAKPVSYYDLSPGFTSSQRYNTQPNITLPGYDVVSLKLALRPITSTKFVYTCECITDSILCSYYGDQNMECVKGKCTCRNLFVYDFASELCILGNVAEEKTVYMSNGDSEDTITDTGTSTCTDTTEAPDPYVVIDLRRTLRIHYIEITTGAPISFPPDDIKIVNGSTATEMFVPFTYSQPKAFVGKPCIKVLDSTTVDFATVSQITDSNYTIYMKNNGPIGMATLGISTSGALMRDFKIGVSRHFSGTFKPGEQAICNYHFGAVADETTLRIHCPNFYSGRYLSIFAESETPIMFPLCDVKVYGLPAAEPFLFPYGDDTHDQVFIGSDDSNIRYSDECVAQGIIYGCQKYKNIFINTNGFVSLGERFDGSRPQQLPLNENIPLIAPLWSDIELGPSPGGDSVVYYNCYKNTEKLVSKNSQLQYIMAKAKDDLQKQGAHAFNLDFLVIITWHKVTPFPFDAASSEKNTFQLVFLQDIGNQLSKMMFLYSHLNWLKQRDNSIGFQGPGENFGTTSPYSGKPLAFTLDDIMGNTGRIGAHSYDITSSNECIDTGSPVYKCNDWYVSQRKTFLEEADKLNRVLPNCPCNRWQASYDPRFVEYETDQDTVCFISHALYSDSERTYTGARQCCFNNSKPLWIEKTLYYQQDFHSGSILKNNPFHYPTNFENQDMVPKKTCCNDADLCHLFYEIRHSTGCDNYVKPKLTWCWGDPHIKTMDGFEYDFNGLGEYWMIKSPKFELQARTTRAMDRAGMPDNATVFSGFAAKGFDTPRVEFLLSDDKQELKVFLDGSQIIESQSYQHNKFLSLRKNGTSFEAKFSSAGIAIIITPQEGFLMIQLSLFAEMRNISRGLLGIYDDDPSNDLTTIDGEVLPLDTRERTIHYVFGEKWRISKQKSLFNYDGSKHTYEKMNNHNFEPLFWKNIREEMETFSPDKKQKMEVICQGKLSCIYDYVVTELENVAKKTYDQDEGNIMDQAKLNNTVPQIDINGTLVLEIGETGTLLVEANDPDGTDQDQLNITGVNLPLDLSFDPVKGILVWKPMSLERWPDVSFYASDGTSNSPAAILTLKLCNCSKHGQCNPDNLKPGYKFTDSFQEVGCFCDKGWDVKYFKTGGNCQNTIDWCARYKPCLEGQECTSTIEHLKQGVNYECGACPDGYEEVEEENKCQDINECDLGSDDCEYICVNTIGSYECRCRYGHLLTGIICTDIDQCELQIDHCGETENCTNIDSGYPGYRCECYPGYKSVGRHICSRDSNLGIDCMCKPPGICILGEDSATWMCHCGIGYEENDGGCKDIDECLSNTHRCVNAECGNTNGSYNCACHDGYTIKEDRRTCKVCPEGTWGRNCYGKCNCKDSTTVCDPGTGCEECSTGFTGGECDEDIDECKDEISCNEHSINCTNTYGSYRCHCEEGYALTPPNVCSVINLCTVTENKFCQNGGVCTFNYDTLKKSCDCTEAHGWTGEHCETNIDECESDPCQNGGTCHDFDGRYECQCSKEYDGITCEIDSSKGSNSFPYPIPLPVPDPASISKAIISFSFDADFDTVVKDETKFKTSFVEQLATKFEVDKTRLDKVTAKKGSIAMNFEFLKDLKGKPVYNVTYELKDLVEKEALLIKDENGKILPVVPDSFHLDLVEEVGFEYLLKISLAVLGGLTLIIIIAVMVRYCYQCKRDRSQPKAHSSEPNTNQTPKAKYSDHSKQVQPQQANQPRKNPFLEEKYIEQKNKRHNVQTGYSPRTQPGHHQNRKQNQRQESEAHYADRTRRSSSPYADRTRRSSSPYADRTRRSSSPYADRRRGSPSPYDNAFELNQPSDYSQTGRGRGFTHSQPNIGMQGARR